LGRRRARRKRGLSGGEQDANEQEKVAILKRLDVRVPTSGGASESEGPKSEGEKE
jgi:hypothetical protein